MTKPWRAPQFAGGYSAEYLKHGMRTWRILRAGGKVTVFPTTAAALAAAQEAFLASLDGNTRATLPIDPRRLAAKLEDEAENWLKSRREDMQAQRAIHKPGRKVVVVMNGRAER